VSGLSGFFACAGFFFAAFPFASGLAAPPPPTSLN